jgi:hypothetical protein
LAEEVCDRVQCEDALSVCLVQNLQPPCTGGDAQGHGTFIPRERVANRAWLRTDLVGTSRALSAAGEMSDYPCLSSFWIAARGEQIINCELLLAREGQAILRCRYGPQAVIRSQLIASADAAAEVAATWQTALEEQGFRIVLPQETDKWSFALHEQSARSDYPRQP